MTQEGNRSRNVLVMGSPRSGTTWLGKVLDSHPDTLYSHEPDSALPPVDVPLYLPLEDAARYEERLRAWVAELKELRTPRVVGKLPVFRKHYRGSIAHFCHYTAVLASKRAPSLRNVPVPLFASRTALEDTVWVWKSIESPGRLAALSRALPSCRAVLLLRHPCGVVSSILRGETRAEFRSSVPSSEDRGIFELLSQTVVARRRGLTTERFFQMNPIERLAWRWALVNEMAMLETESLDNVLLVRYEDLCEDAFGVMRRILEFSGLGWDTQVEAFLGASTSSEKTAYYSVYKDPRRSVSKWKDELDDAQIHTVLAVAQETAPGRMFA